MSVFLQPGISEPEIGDFFVCDVGGWGGSAIAFGELMDGDPFRWLKWKMSGSKTPKGFFPPWMYEHAGVYIGNKTIVQAEPGGAATRTIPTWQFTERVIWSTGAIPMTQRNRADTAFWARRCASDRTGYSWIDYAEIAAHHLGVNTKGLQARIRSSRRMICSQLVDWCYQQAGVKLFDDDRWYGDVTPADLAELLLKAGVK